MWKITVKYLTDYIRDYCHDETSHLFANCMDGNLTRTGVRYRLDCLQKKAAETIPSLTKKKLTPHTFRHTTALRMLQSGVSQPVIWLGHESIITTHKYMEADLEMKRHTLEKMGDPGHPPTISQLMLRFWRCS